MLYLAREERERSIFSVSQVGKQLPANTTAVGKALPAHHSDGHIRELYARPSSKLRALTPMSPVSIDTLHADIHQTRLRDDSIEDGETVAGRCCMTVALPIDRPDSGSVIALVRDHDGGDGGTARCALTVLQREVSTGDAGLISDFTAAPTHPPDGAAAHGTRRPGPRPRPRSLAPRALGAVRRSP